LRARRPIRSQKYWYGVNFGVVSRKFLEQSFQAGGGVMETVTALFVAAVGAFLLTVGIGKTDCISECITTGAGIQCTACDMPNVGNSKASSAFDE
jgi:hypothetical protein